MKAWSEVKRGAQELLAALPDAAEAVELEVVDVARVPKSTLTASYGGRGSESELRELGVVTAGSLTPLKARLRLQVALETGLQPSEAFPV